MLFRNTVRLFFLFLLLKMGVGGVALFSGLNGAFSCLQRENKESRSPRSGAVDLPMVTDSIRNIKSMWEKGNVFNSPGGGGSPFKVRDVTVCESVM